MDWFNEFINIILLIGGILMVFGSMSWLFWGVVTKFSFYWEREVDDMFIYIEAYGFISGW